MTAWTQLIMTEIENRKVREQQQVDAHSPHELLQDISSLATYDVYCDPLMAPDASVTRGLQKIVPLSAPLKYQCVDGSTKPLFLAQAMVAEKTRGRAVISIVNK